MRVLIVYATRQGQTEKVALRIADHLREAGAEVIVHPATEAFDGGGFDVVVYGASMHAGGIEKEMVAFIEAYHDRLAPRRFHFFLVLLSAATRDPARRARSLADAREKAEKALPLKLDHIEMIAGALMYSKYRWPVRWIMKRIAREEGADTDTSRDYEYTDWAQVKAYALSIL